MIAHSRELERFVQSSESHLVPDRSGSENLNRLDKCNTGFFAEA